MVAWRTPVDFCLKAHGYTGDKKFYSGLPAMYIAAGRFKYLNNRLAKKSPPAEARFLGWLLPRAPRIFPAPLEPFAADGFVLL